MSVARNIIRIIENNGYTINEAKTEIKTAIDGTENEFGIKGINAFKKVKKDCDEQGFTAYIIHDEKYPNEFSVVFCGKDRFSGLYSCTHTDMKNFSKLIKAYNVSGHNPFERGWGVPGSEYKLEKTPKETFDFITKYHDKSQTFYVTGEKLFEKLM